MDHTEHLARTAVVAPRASSSPDRVSQHKAEIVNGLNICILICEEKYKIVGRESEEEGTKQKYGGREQYKVFCEFIWETMG